MDVAIELCFIFLSNLSDTYHIGQWKRLHSTILQRQVSDKLDSTYLRILEVLQEGTKAGSVVIRDKTYSIGSASSKYSLGPAYYGKGFKRYRLKTNRAKSLRRKEYYRLLSEASDNAIARNLFRMYSMVDLPTEEDIIKEASTLVERGFHNKKGKKLTFRNKHNLKRWKDVEQRTFVEDNVDLFHCLTDGGYRMPIVTDERAGHRVVDSFSLMPSWIRGMTSVNGNRLVEVDYKALHPNLAVSIYSGQSRYLTHGDVALQADVDRAEVKTCHLSFFNDRWESMQRSPLFPYYATTEPAMMERIHHDKAEHGHKVTSRRLFALEVDLMTKVVQTLNSEGIYVLYVYDALMCEEEHRQRVLEVMNDTAAAMCIYTRAA